MNSKMVAAALAVMSAEERVVGAYKPGFVADCGAPDRRVFVLNCTGTPRVAVRFAAAAKCVVYGPDGARRGDVEIPAGLAEIQVPRGGFVEVAR